MDTAEPVAVEIAALDVARADQVATCARMMSDSEPWITLRRSYDDSVATLTVP